MISPQLSLLFVQSVIVSFLMFSLMACEQNSAVSSASQPKQTLQSSQQEQVMPEITPENEQEASEFSTEHWDTVKTAKYNQIVNNQLAMNAVIWQNLQEKGVMETTELRLDFFYYAPDKESAELLYQFLGRETDYELQDISYNSSSRDWSINGTTQATTVSKEILDQWVGYMVAVGVEYNSTFDGWGTVVPLELCKVYVKAECVIHPAYRDVAKCLECYVVFSFALVWLLASDYCIFDESSRANAHCR